MCYERRSGYKTTSLGRSSSFVGNFSVADVLELAISQRVSPTEAYRGGMNVNLTPTAQSNTIPSKAVTV